MSIIFNGEAHRDFYELHTNDKKSDCYFKAMVYTVGICEDTRKRFDQFYNEKTSSINIELLGEGWQTSGSAAVTRLAYNLYTDTAPSAFWAGDKEISDIQECKRYTVAEIFSYTEFLPFFLEAVKIRFGR